MNKLLLVGDFACHTGFARVLESLAHEWRESYDIAVLALNYLGNPHPLQRHYRLYPGAVAGDPLGINAVAGVVADERPDAIFIIGDPWVIPFYLEKLADQSAPVIAYVPVDGPHLRRMDVEPLNDLTALIAYTHFAARELLTAGYTGPIMVAPHGIDCDLFSPAADIRAAKQLIGIDPDWYTVLVLDRNQPRKQLDIAFAAFAAAFAGVDSARLIYHGALRDIGWDIEDMAHDLGIADKLILTSRTNTPRIGIRTERLPDLYRAADCRLTTTAGEGWGLTIMESMACGVPCIVPCWSALAEWAQGGVRYVPVSSVRRHVGMMNTMAGVVDTGDVVAALLELYNDQDERARIGRAGRALVSQDMYRWSVIADTIGSVIRVAIESDAIERAVASRDLVVSA